MQDNKKLILVSGLLGGILLLLIIITSLLGLSRNNNIQSTLTPTPFARTRSTTSVNRSLTPTVIPIAQNNPRLSTAQTSQLKEQATQISTMTTDEASGVAKVQGILPIETEDFTVDYSPSTGQFFVGKKTPQAENAFTEWLRSNGLLDLFSRQRGLFVITETKGAAQVRLREEEQEIFEARFEHVNNVGVQPPPTIESPQSSQEARDFELLSGLMRTILSFDLGTLNVGQGPTPTGGVPPPPVPSNQSSNAPAGLAAIFNEAGSKIGVPPRILEAVMRLECGRLFSLSPELVAAYSAPGGTLPPNHFCFRNVQGIAYGPMQFTPGTWKRYATAVNRFGGYTHTPHIANIRDSVYGAAEKLKSDSRAADPLVWTQEQVTRAAKCYNNGCKISAFIKSLAKYYHDYVWSVYSGT